MIVLAAMLIAAQAAPGTKPDIGPEVSGSDDIVVVARRMARLKRLRMTTRIDPATGIVSCVFKRRSGDPALDAVVCDAMATCTATSSTMAEVHQCVAPTIRPPAGRGRALGRQGDGSRPMTVAYDGDKDPVLPS